jgi:hypothetical protein
LLHVPKRSRVGGVAMGIRTFTTAATSSALSGARSHKLMFEGPNVGRWSFASTASARTVFDQATLTEAHSAMDEANNRIYCTVNLFTDDWLYYLDLDDSVWKKLACSRASLVELTGAVRGIFVDNERNLLVAYTNTQMIGYVDLSAPTKAWAKATWAGTWLFGDTDQVPQPTGASSYKVRMAKYPVAHGGDDHWYGFWGRGPSSPNDNTTLTTQKALHQYLNKIVIPSVLTDTWQLETVTINDEEGLGGLTSNFDKDYVNAQCLHFTRFFFVPWLRCFAWIPRPNAPVELIRARP